MTTTRHCHRRIFVTLLVGLLGITVRAAPTEPGGCAGTQLPANITFADWLRPALDRYFEKSPTLRAQCARIAAAPHLYVTVQLDPSMRGCRAFTVMRRGSGLTQAQVHLPPANISLAELVGHEFEHIVEQIEGCNLPELARQRGAGVYECEPGLFETERAQLAGVTVAREAGEYAVGR